MSPSIQGADADQLDRLAVLFQEKAQQLDNLGNQVRRAVNQIHWEGGGWGRFRAEWDQQHHKRLRVSSQGLRQASDQLRAQAQDQRRVSGVGNGGGRGTPVGKHFMILPGLLAGVTIRGNQLAYFYANLKAFEEGKALPPYLVKELPELPWALSMGRNELAEKMKANPAEQAAWWGGLTPERQAALLFAFPGVLLALHGLPDGVVAAAKTQFALSQLGVTEVASRQESVSGTVRLKADVGAKVSADLTVFATGRTEVTVSLEGELGKKFHEGGVSGKTGIEGGVSATYEFRSLEDAQAFVEGLKERLAPDPLRSLAGDGAVDYLHSYGSFWRSTELSLAEASEVSVKVGDLDVHVAGAVGGTYNPNTYETSVFVEIGGGMNLGSGGLSVGGEVHGRVSLQYNDLGVVSGATLSGTMTADASLSSGALVKSLTGVDAGVTGGTARSVSFSATIDPGDPMVKAELARLAENPGDTKALQSLLGHSEAHITVATSVTGGESVDAGVIALEHKVSSSTTDAAYAKPKAGPWVAVPVN